MKKKIYTNSLKNIAKANSEERNVLPATKIYQKVKHIKSGICTKGKKKVKKIGSSEIVIYM